MKHFAMIAFVTTLVAPVAQAWESRTPHEVRDTIVWNQMENEVAVIKGTSYRFGEDFLVIQPTKKFSGLGRYEVVMPKDTLTRRPKGGWYTSVTIDELPFLPPEIPQFFQPSGI
ncbi:MAG: hypothetical protein H0U98_00045 [Alphaproteobacteria bacterium]|nr:hypothetical protein [Alphaproteobacteria bacterium]